MADSKSVYPNPVSRKPLKGLKRSPADTALGRAAYGGPMKEMVTTYDNGEESPPYSDFDLSELTSRTPVKEALRRPKNNATIPTPKRNLKYPAYFDLERGYTGKKGTEKNDAAERQAKTLERMAKGGKVKRFDMGGYTAGMEAMGRRAAEKAANERDSDYKSKRMAAEKARRDEQIALDKADGIQEFAPEKYLIPGVAARSVLRNAVPAIVRGGADILRNEFMGPQTSEGLPTAQRLRDVRSRVAPGRLVRNKSDMERVMGIRNQYKPGTSNTRNKQYRAEAEEMGIPPLEYLKGRTAAEEGSMGLNPNQTSTNAMDQLRWKKGGVVPKGGKVGKVMGEFKSGALKSSSGQKVTNRKQAMAIAMSEAGKSKMKKYAEGGKVKKMAGGGMFGTKAAAAGAAKGYGAAKAAMDAMRGGMGGAGTGLGNIGNAAMGAMKGYGTGLGNAAMGGMRGAGTGGFNTAGLGNALGAAKGAFGMKNGGKVPKAKASSAGENAKYVGEEVTFMEKHNAPKKLIGHEKRERDAGGMKKGGMACMKRGGGIEKKGYGPVQKFAKGGSIDGCAVRGKTKGTVC